MAQTNAPHPSPAAAMKVKNEDIIFGALAIIALIALALYMS